MSIPYRELSCKGHLHQYEVTAPSIPELFANCIGALTDVLTDVKLVEESEDRVIEATGHSREELLTQVMRGALALYEKEKFFCSSCGAPSIEEARGFFAATLKVRGEKLSMVRHPHRAEVKAVQDGIFIKEVPLGFMTVFSLEM
ncbi:MAG: archease [Candidatus Peribacteraceae bacterium]|nr:archease [Candidatus Peribacteraceae bacterium]MDD5075283.1 archease [Candidatus Peribacteraceae bacterium]